MLINDMIYFVKIHCKAVYLLDFPKIKRCYFLPRQANFSLPSLYSLLLLWLYFRFLIFPVDWQTEHSFILLPLYHHENNFVYSVCDSHIRHHGRDEGGDAHAHLHPQIKRP